MPELPEVETIRTFLSPLIIGKQIRRARVTSKRVVEEACRDDISRSLAGKRIRTFQRRGKYLVLGGENFSLLFHLGMSGRLIFMPHATPVVPHTHLVISFSDGSQLHFQDPRAFGRIKLYPFAPGSPRRIPELARLGWDPLEDGITPLSLWQCLQRRKSTIKQSLLDQHLISGIGNIYASEILFRAGIHPLQPSHRLSKARVKRLCQALGETLDEAIRRGGTTILSFRDPEGRRGGFQDHLQVYGRNGQPCPRCRTLIGKEIIAGRSTYFCPRCQRRKRDSTSSASLTGDRVGELGKRLHDFG